jgi:hypothetical protein
MLSGASRRASGSTRHHDETGTAMTDREAPAGTREEALRVLEGALRLWHRAGRMGTLPVEGRSMAPTLRGRSRVWFLPLERGPARRGEILLYRQGELLVVHRVLRRHPGPAYRTKGDGRPTFDSALVPADAVIGRVVAFERQGRPVSAEGRGPRLYASFLSLHSEAVGLLSRVAGFLDGLLGRLAGGRSLRPLRWCVAVADRLVVRTVDALFFGLCHPAWNPPSGEGRDGGS